MHVLQMLLYYGERGVSKDTLLKILFGANDSVADAANNLKVLISNLRRLLKRTALPETTTIVFKAGSYYFVSDIPVEIDVQLFEEQVKKTQQMQDEEFQQALSKVCSLYGGDFCRIWKHMSGLWWQPLTTKKNTVDAPAS